MKFIKNNISVILISGAAAAAAYFLGGIFPAVGGSVFGIFLGMIINNTAGKPALNSELETA